MVLVFKWMGGGQPGLGGMKVLVLCYVGLFDKNSKGTVIFVQEY